MISNILRLMTSATMSFSGRPHNKMMPEDAVCGSTQLSIQGPSTCFGMLTSAATKHALVILLANLFSVTRCITSLQDTRLVHLYWNTDQIQTTHCHECRPRTQQ